MRLGVPVGDERLTIAVLERADAIALGQACAQLVQRRSHATRVKLR
jgi:hypothetical protein